MNHLDTILPNFNTNEKFMDTSPHITEESVIESSEDLKLEFPDFTLTRRANNDKYYSEYSFQWIDSCPCHQLRKKMYNIRMTDEKIGNCFQPSFQAASAKDYFIWCR